tara:strand:- start:289 stop:750 length:462 start_codon:yes stop_codon:yes gene_type:complete
MKTLQMITLFFLFIHPIVIRANPVKGISDFDGEFKGVERIDFECPPNDVRKIRKSSEELEEEQPQKRCWVDFYPTYLNVMDKQVINKNNVISFFQAPPASGKCCASWNLIYIDNDGKTRMLSMRRNDLPFPLTKRKLKRLGTPANIINRWLAQ